MSRKGKFQVVEGGKRDDDLRDSDGLNPGESSYEVLTDRDVESVHDGDLDDSLAAEEDVETRLAPSPLSASGSWAPPTPPSSSSSRPGSGGNVTRSERVRPSSEPSADHRIGQVLSGRYRLERLIGKGGMGRVYLATQFPLNRSVAVKILNPEFQRKDPQFVRRFFLEAATAARLSHPNTITVFDYGESDRKELYIAMEYLRGKPLSRVIKSDGPLSAGRTMHVTMQMVRALREAHSKGIIHRDLKPGNIMLLEEGDDADFAKVLDFGLVKLFATGTDNESLDLMTPGKEVGDLTRAGMFLGSPKYMSPEQIQGVDLDPRTDIYSLGVIMFQMLVGRPPYRGKSSVEVIYKHVNEPIPLIHDMNPDADAPPELEELVRTCLSKKREQRFASMSELRHALEDVRRLLLGVSSATGGFSDISSMSSRPSFASSAPAVVAEPTSEAAALLEPLPYVSDESEARDESSAASKAENFRTPIARVAPYIAGVSLVLLLGSAAYLVSSRTGTTPIQPSPQKPAPAAKAAPVASPPASVTSKITLQSTPEGAAVTAQGRLLGVTPFVHTVVLEDGEAQSKVFTFTKDGYQDEVVSETIDGPSLRIHARLQALPKAKPTPSTESPRVRRPRRPRRPPRKPKPESSEYKDNPY